MKRLVILNPKSRHGLAEREFASCRAGWEERLGPFDLHLTRGPGDATETVRRALREGEVDQIIAAGGDGTVHEAFLGYWSDGLVTNTRVPLGIINLGTGGDFYRTVRRTGPDYESALVENRFRLVDAGVITKPGAKSLPFLNIASVGMAAAMLGRLKASRFQAGAAAYFLHTLATLLGYRPRPAKVDYVDAEGTVGHREVDLINLFACNGRFSGGGMEWAPGARLDDGLLRLTLVTGRRKWPLILHARKVYAGRVAEMPGAEVLAVRELTVTCAEELGLEADGEIVAAEGLPAGSVHFEVKPSVFPLIL